VRINFDHQRREQAVANRGSGTSALVAKDCCGQFKTAGATGDQLEITATGDHRRRAPGRTM